MADDDQAQAVLVVEDEWLISLDLCDLLSEAGYGIIGPAATQAHALALLNETAPDLGIVDVQLRDGRCRHLVQQLRLRAIPFLIHSGLPVHDLEGDGFDDVPRLNKPASLRALLDALDGLGRRARTTSRRAR